MNQGKIKAMFVKKVNTQEWIALSIFYEVVSILTNRLRLLENQINVVTRMAFSAEQSCADIIYSLRIC